MKRNTKSKIKKTEEKFQSIQKSRVKYSLTSIDQYLCTPPPPISSEDVHICQCNKKVGKCGSECLNRMINIECLKQFCSPKCTNNQIQQREWKKVKCKKASNKGRGLYANEFLKKGEFVIEYVGEVLSNQQMEERLHEYPDAEHFYFITLGPNMILDASKKGNNASNSFYFFLIF